MPRPRIRNADRAAGASKAGPAGSRPGGSRDRTFLSFVLDQLSGLDRVESRAMFGGHGLYRDGVFFAILWRGRIFFLTDDASRVEYEARGMRPFAPRPSQKLRRYYEVPPEVLEDAAEAVRWARAAVALRGAP